ncbi:MAG: NUDIX domain-containing protein [Magnetococcales bacterium]|nr:NUDIX domain-containing protein [Magnetococcales bacterium]
MGNPILEATRFLEKAVANPSQGLPDEVFYYISRVTPMVNVDLLIKDEDNRTLLSWRDDKFADKSWHIPGGIIRFKETFEERLKKVAEIEIGIPVQFDPEPIAVNQIIVPEFDTRGHFISMLYKCFLPKSFIPENIGLTKDDQGFLEWHSSCPEHFYKYQDIYRPYL